MGVILSLQITWLSVHVSFPPVTGRGEVGLFLVEQNPWFLALFRWMISWWWVSTHRGVGIYLPYVLLRSFTHSPFLGGMGEQYKDPIFTLTTFSCQWGGNYTGKYLGGQAREKGSSENESCAHGATARIRLALEQGPTQCFSNRMRHTGHTWQRFTHTFLPQHETSDISCDILFLLAWLTPISGYMGTSLWRTRFEESSRWSSPF